MVGNSRLPGVRKFSERIREFLKPHVRSVRVVIGLRDITRFREDLVVILGGDGSILNVAPKLGPKKVPVVGIQMGRFGFLSELTPTDCEENLLRIITGKARIEERMMLECTVRQGRKIVYRGTALNDAVMASQSVSRMVTIDMGADGDFVTTYHGDGVIVATPVGSTAHNLSAGGPIVEPGMNSYVVNPICSHALTTRPLVISAARNLEFRMNQSRYPIILTLDGQQIRRLDNRDVLGIRKSPHSIRLVKVTDRTYFETLRRKFNWAGTSLNNCGRQSGWQSRRPEEEPDGKQR